MPGTTVIAFTCIYAHVLLRNLESIYVIYISWMNKLGFRELNLNELPMIRLLLESDPKSFVIS